MKFFKIRCVTALLMLGTGCASSMHGPAASQPTTAPVVEDPTLTGTETLVFLRHGEKPAMGLGQLTPQGLNRALALSTVLPAKYGRPDYIFAPDPVMTRVTEHGGAYFYVRPLTTIEPTAILLGMPIQTPYGFSQIDKLNAELTDARYAKSTIFIAWEHGYENKAVVRLMKQYGGNAATVPRWPGSDYDSLYVVRIIRVAGKKTVVTFTHDQEGLNGLSKTLPAIAVSTEPTTEPSTNPSTMPTTNP